MLEENRFLAVKNLAKDIRQENEKLFEALKNEPVTEAIKQKDDFINQVIDGMDIAFSEGDKGREERKIFRANILIPDDVEFFQAYSNDKNIRNLMNKYAVGIDDIMSKITELNLYSKYIDIFNDKPSVAKEEKETVEPVEIKIEEPKEEKIPFASELSNISSKNAGNLLDEIEDLSNAMEDLDIKSEPKFNEPAISLEPETIKSPEVFDFGNDEVEKLVPFESEKMPSYDNFDDDFLKEDTDDKIVIDDDFIKKDTNDNKNIDDIFIKEKINNKNIDDKYDVISDVDSEEDAETLDEIENIGSAVSEFIDEYTKVKKELDFAQAKVEKFTSEKDELRKQLSTIKDEMDNLRQEKVNAEKELEKAKDDLAKAREEANRMSTENKDLRKQVEVMERNAKQSTDLLKQIYKTIPKKRFNVK